MILKAHYVFEKGPFLFKQVYSKE